jgi:2-polyprenyl-3-methyl-5-hydroxy-6-metoxy-1,4-benzoquinol methylase
VKLKDRASFFSLKVALSTINQTKVYFTLYILKGKNILLILKPLSTQDYNQIRGITKLPNSEQSYKGKVKTHKYINRQNQSTTGKL